MKLIAFVEGRPRPQPRTTTNVRFLFTKSVEQWVQVDAENAEKAAMGLQNSKGKPYKPTRFAYRLGRLQLINEYRRIVFEAVNEACGGKIPAQYLFFFYLLHTPKSWSRKKRRSHEWTLQENRPDYSNLLKGIEDCLYKNDGKCNAVAHYKIYVPLEYKEGLVIIEDSDIHKYVIEAVLDGFIKKAAPGPL